MKVYIVHIEIYDQTYEKLVSCGVDSVFDSEEKAIEHVKTLYGDEYFDYLEVEGWKRYEYETYDSNDVVYVKEWEVN